MKPLSLCLVQMGDKGLEMVKSHPNVLPKEVLNEVTLKSMPMGAKPGEFSTSNVGDLYYSSYIFKIPRPDQRDNIAAIIAIYNNMKYNMEGIQKVFSFIIKELDSKSLLKADIILRIIRSNLGTDRTLKYRPAKAAIAKRPIVPYWNPATRNSCSRLSSA